MTLSQRAIAAVLLVFFALLPAASVAGGLALAPLIGLAGVLCLLPSLLRQGFGNAPAALWMMLAFATWAAISSLWTPYHDHLQALRLGLTLLGLLFVGASAGASRLTLTAATAALIVLVGLLAIEALFDMPLNRAFSGAHPTWEIERNPSRGVSILLAMVWAVAAGLIAKGGPVRLALATALTVSVGALASQFHDTANFIAFGLGVLTFALGFSLPIWGPRLVSALLAAWTLAAPLALPLLTSNQRIVDALPFSWAVRVGIWRYVCGRIAEHPLFGSGLDASRAVADTITVRGDTMRAVQLHPHSASLQIWFETGGIGAVLAASALVMGGWAISRLGKSNRPFAAAACATLATLGFIANISFGIWQEWWIATMLVAAALLVAISANPKPL